MPALLGLAQVFVRFQEVSTFQFSIREVEMESKVGAKVLGRLSLNDQFLYEKTVGKLGAWGYLESMGVALKGHFVFTAGGHGDAYINIRDLKTIRSLAPIAMQMAWVAFTQGVFHAVVGTPHGADTLAVLVAYYYEIFSGIEVMVPKLLKSPDGLIWYKDHASYVVGARILQIEDTINSGDSLRKTANFISQSDCKSLDFIAVCNRLSDKNPSLESLREKVGANRAWALVEVEAENYSMDLSFDPREQCPLCASGEKVDMRVGHGKKFLAEIETLYPDLHTTLSCA